MNSSQLAIFLAFDFSEWFLSQTAHTGCYEFITVSEIQKTAFPKAWHSHARGSGVIKLTANRASVLANKPQVREKTGKVA
jgi:hypothetical protein